MGRLASIFMLLSLVGCRERDEASSDPRPPQPAAAAPSVRSELEPFRPLLDEMARGELRAPGLLIDFGTPDQHKYTRGGWGTGWGEIRRGDRLRYAVIDDDTARLTVRLVQEPAELQLRARSPGGPQEIEIRAGDHLLGGSKLGADWSVVRVPASGLEPGMPVALSITRLEDKPLHVDWAAIVPADAGADVPARARPKQVRLEQRAAAVALGGRVRRALVAPTARTYSFYLQVPAGGQLVFDAGSSSAVEFVVRVETVDGEVDELLRVAARPGEWTEQVVDLARFAGQAIRLELATEGDAPSTGWGEPAVYVPRSATPHVAASEPRPAKNLVVVVLDTTVAKAFAPFDPDNRVYAPVMDRFARNGTAFVAAYNNDNWTKPSTATILSALYPPTHTARKATSAIPDDVQLLPEHLKRHGFHTALFTGNAVLNEQFGFARGWDTFKNYTDSSQGNGKLLYRHAVRWLEQNHDRGRFFLYIQSIDAHTTYSTPPKYWRRYFDGVYAGKLGSSFEVDEQLEIDRGAMKVSDEDLAWVRALYHAEISYQDEQLGVLLDKLDELGRLDDTVVVITNDHGEEIREHGHMGHGWTLYDELLRAPLAILYPPLFPEKTQVGEVIEHVDLAPTLIEALGLPPMRDVEGMSFLTLFDDRPEQRPFYAVSSSNKHARAIRVGRWKLVVDKDDGWRQLHDLKTDPDEQADRLDDANLAARLCEIYLGEAMASPAKAGRLAGMHVARRVRSRDTHLGPKLRRMLETLGYL